MPLFLQTDQTEILKTPAAIIIADDHEDMLQSLVGILGNEQGLEIVGLARNGQDLVEKANQLAPDLCIVDYEMPGLNGLMASEKMLKNNQNEKIIILTMHNEKSLLRRIKAMGIKGYLLKGCENKELMTAINTVLEGETYYS